MPNKIFYHCLKGEIQLEGGINQSQHSKELKSLYLHHRPLGSRRYKDIKK